MEKTAVPDASHPDVSAWVMANAGAGKTRLLTERVLRLLLAGVTPGRILCITFTNAAAAEMKERVHACLAQWVMMDEPELTKALGALEGEAPAGARMDRARRLFASVLEAPEGLRIQTIHGFCQSMLRRFPVESGVAPHFTVIDERTEEELLHEAQTRLFNSVPNGADERRACALATLAGSLHEASFKELLAALIKQKRHLIPMLKRAGGVDGIAERIRHTLGLDRDTTLAALLKKHFSYDAETLAALRAALIHLQKSDRKDDRRIHDRLAPWLAQESNRMAHIEAYLSAFFTDKCELRKKLAAKGTLPRSLDEALYDEQARACRFRERYDALKVAGQSEHLLHVADALMTLYQALKHHRALLDFDDLILAARDLLHKPGVAPWVLFKLDGGIDHILIDEAQDTSPDQWAIAQALSEEFFAGEGRAVQSRTVFVVGDEKQSIYSFQGADPAAFGRMRELFSQRIRDTGNIFHQVALERSFRSTPEVLRAVDAVFSQPLAGTGLTSVPMPIAHQVMRTQSKGLVELWPLMREGPQGESPRLMLARHIADTIGQWLTDGVALESHGRPLEPGDIMILLRRRDALAGMLVRALKRRGVPVAGIDRMMLTENLAVKDLMALGYFLLLPQDDFTLAGLLRSPLCGLSEEELFALAWERRDETLWERLRTFAARGGAYDRACAMLKDLLARADYVPPYELYIHALDTLGGRRRITGRMGGEYADPIEEFLGQALVFERAHTPSLQGFLHWLERSGSEIKRDPQRSDGEVRLLTTHGAKGLQAPVVILPDTTQLPLKQSPLLWHQDGHGQALLFWPPPGIDCAFTRDMRGVRRRREEHEYRRLLYVAMTRAEDRLYIAGCAKRHESAAGSWYALVQEGLQPIAKPFETGWGEGWRVGDVPAVTASSHTVGDVATHAQPGSVPLIGFSLDAPPPEPVPGHPITPSTGLSEPAAASPALNQKIYQRGRAVHRLLQLLPELEPERRVAAARALMAQDQGMFCDAERAAMIEEALRIVNDPRFAHVFSACSLTEAPVAGSVRWRGKIVSVSAQIDRLSITPQGIYVLDYKTNRAPPESAEKTPPAYLRQMALYRKLLQSMHPGVPVHCALLWTAVPALMPLPEGLFLDEETF